MSVSAAPKVRVLIVEDSPSVQTLLRLIIARDERLAVVGVVPSAEEALAAIPRLTPDVISMDIRLPGMDGLEATRQIMSRHPTPIVVVADAVEDRSLRISLNALRAGALSVVEKPAGFAHKGHALIAEEIRTQLFIMSQVPVIRRRQIGTIFAERTRAARLPPMGAGGRLEILGLVASTGGPNALARVLGGLGPDFPLPVLVVQHIGPTFVPGFAAWLDGLVAPRVVVAEEGEMPEAGMVYVAPGDRHLAIGADRALTLRDDGPVAGQRPSGSVLFDSMATAYGRSAFGVLLTGMGEDGATGLLALRRAGATTMTEDESSAVVYGMPGSAMRMGASQYSLPLDEIAPAVLRLASRNEA